MRIIQGIIMIIFTAFILAVTFAGEYEKNDAANPLVTRDNTHEGKIPDNFVLNNEGEIFKTVTFPHKVHIEIVGDCKLCHHNSPEGETPSCKTCHCAPFDPENLEKPGSKGAYHRRCIGCHKEYDSGPVGCVECHDKK